MSQKPEMSIRVCPGGPYLVRGDVVIIDEDGQETRIEVPTALCRCGRSTMKPLCDGTHKAGTQRFAKDGASEPHTDQNPPEHAIPAG